jgi:uncharacterized phage protein gp47/JayE
MSLETKSVSEVSDLIIAGLQAELAQTIPILPKSFCRVLAKVLAAVFILIWKYAGFQFLQLFVAHATMKETIINGKRVIPLVEWGRLIGEGDPHPAVRAEHVVNVTVLSQTGALKADQKLVRTETGVIYQVLSEVLLNAPTVQVRVRAVSDQQGGDGSGTIGNLANGDKLSFASTPPNVASEATVASTAVSGAEAEDPEVYRARVIGRFQARPQGGAYADYRTWGKSVPGILHVYPYTGSPGIVEVFIEVPATAENPDGLPTQAQTDAVFAAIELDVGGRATRRPANAAVGVQGIFRTVFDVQTTELIPDTPTLRIEIREALDEYFRSREPFIVGLSVLPRQDRITHAAVSGIVNDVVSAHGATVATAILLLSGNDIPAYTLGHGEKARLGEVFHP